MFAPNIFSYITTEKTSYQTREVQILDNWSWSMVQHITTSISMKLGKFLNSSNDLKTKSPFRNIVLRNLRLRYQAEDIDVKDVTLYVEDIGKQHLSFLIKKYYQDVFLIENDLDSFFDRALREKIDLGGTLVKKGKNAVPEVIPLQEIAFCDQTDIMGSPIGLKMDFSPGKLRQMKSKGWGDKKNGATISIEDLIILASNEKDPATTQENQSNELPGKNIEVYVIRGDLPESYLKDKGDDELMINQVQIVAFYKTKNGKEGTILYRAKENESIYKFHQTPSEEIYNRALGIGGAEELFDSQIWTNFAEIHKNNMLQAASKVVFQTTDEGYTNRNKIKDLENLEVTTTKDGSIIQQIPTGSPNIQLFTQALFEWDEHGKQLSGATDPLLGKQPPSGTPFRLQERVVMEGKSLHEHRRGQFAKFVEEIFRDWIIPHIAREITKGVEFLSELSQEEFDEVVKKVSTNHARRQIIEDIISGRIPEAEEVLVAKERTKLLEGGNRQFLKILKDELKNANIKVKVNVAGKQKNLDFLATQLGNVLRTYLSSPQLRQDPLANKLLNQILEASGLNPIGLVEQQAIQGLPQQVLQPQALPVA